MPKPMRMRSPQSHRVHQGPPPKSGMSGLVQSGSGCHLAAINGCDNGQPWGHGVCQMVSGRLAGFSGGFATVGCSGTACQQSQHSGQCRKSASAAHAPVCANRCSCQWCSLPKRFPTRAQGGKTPPHHQCAEIGSLQRGAQAGVRTQKGLIIAPAPSGGQGGQLLRSPWRCAATVEVPHCRVSTAEVTNFQVAGVYSWVQHTSVCRRAGPPGHRRARHLGGVPSNNRPAA